MPVALVTIEKEFNSKTWENTWGVAVDDFNGKITSNAQIAAIVGALLLSGNMDDQTNPTSEDYANESTGASALAAIVGFERLMTFANTRFLRAYVSDGKTKQRGVPGPSGVFASISLGGFGLRSTTGITPAPASIVLGVNRNPATFSVRQGLWMGRNVVQAPDVTFGDDDGVAFTSNAIAAGYAAILTSALNTSKLNAAVGPIVEGTWNDTKVCIPVYQGRLGGLPGAIAGGHELAGLSVREPMSRQAKRGRRRTT